MTTEWIKGGGLLNLQNVNGLLKQKKINLKLHVIYLNNIQINNKVILLMIKFKQ